MTKPVWSHVLASVPSQTIPDCIRYIIGVFCYNFKSQTNILASYKHTRLCQSYSPYSPCSEIYTSHTLCRITILFMNAKRTQLRNINFMTCSKAEI